MERHVYPRTVVSVSYIQDKNKFNNISKLCRNEGRNGSTGSTTFDYWWKSMESWVVAKNLVFYNDYNTPVPTLFKIYKKRSLACRVCGTLQTCYLLWSTVRLFHIITWQPLVETVPLFSHPGMHWAALWVWALGTLPVPKCLLRAIQGHNLSRVQGFTVFKNLE